MPVLRKEKRMEQTLIFLCGLGVGAIIMAIVAIAVCEDRHGNK